MKRGVWRTTVRSVVLFTLSTLVLGSIALGLIGVDWLFTETHAAWVAWTLGLLVVFGFVLSLGIGLGMFLQWHCPETVKVEPAKEYHVTDTLENLIVSATQEPRD